MSKKIIILIILIVSVCRINAQKIDRWVISNGSGNFYETANIDYTLGQIITPTLNNNLVITSGFEQPEKINLKSEKQNEIENFEISFFPNPVEDNLNIFITSKQDINSVQIKIYDANGKEIICNTEFSNNNNFSNLKTDLNNTESGVYVVSLIINNFYHSYFNIIKK